MEGIITDTALVALHTGVQFVVGITVGTIIDQKVMPAPNGSKPATATAFAVDAIEAGAQVALNGIVSLMVLRSLSNLTALAADPTNGFAFFLAQMLSQPNLFQRVGALSQYIGEAIDGVEKDGRVKEQFISSMARDRRMGVGSQLGGQMAYSA